MSDDASLKLGLDGSGFQAALEKVNHGLEQIGEKALEIGEMLGVGFGTAEIIEAGKSLLEYASHIRDVSEGLELTTDKYQGFVAALRRGGASAEDFEKAYSKLIQRVESARRGSAEDVELFNRLGVSWQNLKSQSPDEIFLQIAEHVRTSKDHGAAFTDVLDLMGKTARKLVPGMQELGAGIKTFGEEAAKVSAEEIEQMDALQKRWEEGWEKMKANAIHALFGVKDALASIKRVGTEGNLTPAESASQKGDGMTIQEVAPEDEFAPIGTPRRPVGKKRRVNSDGSETILNPDRPPGVKEDMRVLPPDDSEKERVRPKAHETKGEDPISLEMNTKLRELDEKRLAAQREGMSNGEKLTSFLEEQKILAGSLEQIDQSTIKGKREALALSGRGLDLERSIAATRNAVEADRDELNQAKEVTHELELEFAGRKSLAEMAKTTAEYDAKINAALRARKPELADELALQKQIALAKEGAARLRMTPEEKHAEAVEQRAQAHANRVALARQKDEDDRQKRGAYSDAGPTGRDYVSQIPTGSARHMPAPTHMAPLGHMPSHAFAQPAQGDATAAKIISALTPILNKIESNTGKPIVNGGGK